MGIQTPHSYKTPDLETIKTRSPNYSQKKGVPRIPKELKDQTPSPVKYNGDDKKIS